MAGYPSISALDSLYNDPMARAALSSPNYYQLLASKNTMPQYDMQQVSDITSVENVQSPENTSFKSSPQIVSIPADDSDNTMAWLLTGVTAVGAAALYARHKGDGNFIKGAKTIYNGVLNFGKKWSNKLFGKNTNNKNILNVAGKDIQEYTLMKDGMQFVMQGKNPVKIVTSDKKVLTKNDEIANFMKENSEIDKIIRGLRLGKAGDKLPQGVSLSYAKDVQEGKKNLYRMVVEDGKVVKASSRDGNNKWIEIPESQLEAFLNNHPAQVKEAETLTKSLGTQSVRLADGTTKKGALRLSVRNGEVTEASLNGKVLNLSETEMNMLTNDFAKQINLVGKENPSTYGLKNFEYIYRTSADSSKGIIGGQKFRFNTNVSGHVGQNWITSASIRNERILTETNKINDFLSKNTEIKNGLESFANGNTVDGLKLGSIKIKSKGDNIYKVVNGEVKEIKLSDGKTISGNKAIKDWRKTASNENDYNQILSSIAA